MLWFFSPSFKIHAGDEGCTCHSSSGDGRTSSLKAWLLCLGLEFLIFFFSILGTSVFSGVPASKVKQHRKNILTDLDVNCFSLSSSIIVFYHCIILYDNQTIIFFCCYLLLFKCSLVRLSFCDYWGLVVFLSFWTIEHQELAADNSVRLDPSFS